MALGAMLLAATTADQLSCSSHLNFVLIYVKKTVRIRTLVPLELPVGATLSERRPWKTGAQIAGSCA